MGVRAPLGYTRSVVRRPSICPIAAAMPFLHAHRDDCFRAWAVGTTVVISIHVPPDSSCKLTRVFVTGIFGLGLSSASAKSSMNSR